MKFNEGLDSASAYTSSARCESLQNSTETLNHTLELLQIRCKTAAKPLQSLKSLQAFGALLLCARAARSDAF